jgi:hypothetical protein
MRRCDASDWRLFKQLQKTLSADKASPPYVLVPKAEKLLGR